MSTNVYTTYSPRANAPDGDYPFGSIKNESVPGADDGTPVEKAWANNIEGFHQAILSAAGVTPNNIPDTAIDSQLYTAFQSLVSANVLSKLVGCIGDSRNLAMSVTADSISATLTADELIVGTTLGGVKYQLSNFSKTINLSTTGAGGMDVGSAPVSGYVAVYAILNPTTGISALLAVNATSSKASEIYSGANMPSGYTASALVSVWPTNASGQFKIGTQLQRTVSFPSVTVLNTATGATTLTAVSMSTAVPLNAKFIDAYSGIQTSAITSINTKISPDLNSVGAFPVSNAAATLFIQYTVPNIPVIVPQTIYRQLTIGGGTVVNHTISVAKYSF